MQEISRGLGTNEAEVKAKSSKEPSREHHRGVPQSKPRLEDLNRASRGGKPHNGVVVAVQSNTQNLNKINNDLSSPLRKKLHLSSEEEKISNVNSKPKTYLVSTMWVNSNNSPQIV